MKAPYEIVKSGINQFHGLKNYIDTSNIEINEIVGEPESVSFFSRPSRANMETKPEDVIWAKMANTRKVLLIDTKISSNIYSTGFFVFRPDPILLRSKYLYYWLRWENTELLKNRLAHGETQRQLNNKQFTKKFKVPTPDLDIQDKIITELDKIESVLIRLRQQRRLAEKLLISEREEEFSILMKNSLSLIEACREPPYRYPTFYGFDYVKSGIPVLKISNMTPDGKLPTDTEQYDHITEEINKRFPKTIVSESDLILEVRGTYIGKTALVPKELAGSNISPNTMRITLNEKVIPNYFWHYTFTSWWQNQIDRITRRWKLGFGTVRADRLRHVRVPTPDQEIQIITLSKLSKIDEILEQFSRNMMVCEELLQSNLQRYFGSGSIP